jgi:hypothetical protein
MMLALSAPPMKAIQSRLQDGSLAAVIMEELPLSISATVLVLFKW